MGKAKGAKGGDGIPQRHLHSRISYLHQAAAYLATARIRSNKSPEVNDIPPSDTSSATQRWLSSQRQSRYLLNQLHGVSKKSQIRLGRDVKHSICRRCDSLLIPGATSSQEVKNESKGEGKPWADIFEVRCSNCGALKRFPVALRADSGDKKLRQVLVAKPGNSKTATVEPLILAEKN